MGKPTGFMEYDRELPQDRSPLERLNDWEEFHEHFAEAKLQQQGARCMDCGIPFCHTGQLISGMASGVRLITLSRNGTIWFTVDCGKKPRAASQDQQFSRIYRRVCPAPCEGSCVLGINELR